MMSTRIILSFGAISVAAIMVIGVVRAEHPCLRIVRESDNPTFGASFRIVNTCAKMDFKVRATCSNGKADSLTVLNCSVAYMLCGNNDSLDVQPMSIKDSFNRADYCER